MPEYSLMSEESGVVSHGFSPEERSWFVAEVAKSLPQRAHQYIPTAAEHVIDLVESLGGDIEVLLAPRIAHLAAGVASDMAKLAGQARATAPKPHYDAATLLSSERVAALAERRVQAIRTELFATAAAPFTAWQEAQTWLSEEAGRPFEHAVWEQAHKRLNDLLEREVNALLAAGSPFRYRQNLGVKVGVVYFADEHGQRSALSTLASEKLRKLAQTQDEIVRDFGWLAEEVTLFILLGIPPIEPRYRLMSRSQLTNLGPKEGWLGIETLQIDIHDRFFGYEDLRELFRTITATGFVRRRKSLAQLDKLQRLWLFVQERRPRPTDWRGIVCKKMPWKQVHAQWNAAHPGEAYGSLRGLLKAYKEACAYME